MEEFENNYKEINVDSENVERVSEIKKNWYFNYLKSLVINISIEKIGS